MISMLLTQLAMAAPVTDELVHVVVDELQGKDVPEKAVCIERPSLPAPFATDLVAIGIMEGDLGCQLMGVMVDGSFKKPEIAAAAAIDEQSWSSARSSERATWMQQWTTTVHLVFKQFDMFGTSPTSSASGSAYQVQATYWERDEQDWTARHASGSFRYDGDGKLLDESVEGPRFKSTFSAREYRLNGLNGDAIHHAMTQQGRSLVGCAMDAFKTDLQFEGRTRMQFTLAGGQASQIALVAQDDKGTGIERCYGRALGKIAFPASLNGTVVWAFNVSRTELAE
jgi:hypothetical protein